MNPFCELNLPTDIGRNDLSDAELGIPFRSLNLIVQQ